MRHSALRSSWAAALALMAVLVLAPQAGFATVPQTINYQGSLTDPAGAPIDGTVDMTFSLYSDSGGVAQLWTETQTGVAVTDGVFSVTLGADTVTPNLLDPSWFDNPVWLGVTVGTDPQMTPLQEIDAVGFAIRAKGAETAGLSALSLSSGDLDCTGCVTESELDFDPATQSELGAAVAAIDWSVLTSVPADIADGDDVLSELQVENFINDEAINLFAGSQVNSQDILTTGSSLSWSSLTGVPADLADGDDGFTTMASTAGTLTPVAAGGTATATATCGAGVATGGGFLADSEFVYAYQSYPLNATTWQVLAKNTDTSGHNVTAYVMCATTP